jgi:hypothetical protein
VLVVTNGAGGESVMTSQGEDDKRT